MKNKLILEFSIQHIWVVVGHKTFLMIKWIESIKTLLCAGETLYHCEPSSNNIWIYDAISRKCLQNMKTFNLVCHWFNQIKWKFTNKDRSQGDTRKSWKKDLCLCRLLGILEMRVSTRFSKHCFQVFFRLQRSMNWDKLPVEELYY